MVSLKDVEEKLAAVGMHNKFWGRPEVKELRNVLTPEEHIIGAVNGSYEHGFAMLVATDHRVLLIDKKPLFLSLEDLRYDMISEVTYSTGILTATLTILVTSEKLKFKSVQLKKLRTLTAYLQQHIMEIRQKGQHDIGNGSVQQIPIATPQTVATQMEATPVPTQYTPVKLAPLDIETATNIGSLATNFSLVDGLQNGLRSPFPAVPLNLTHKPTTFYR